MSQLPLAMERCSIEVCGLGCCATDVGLTQVAVGGVLDSRHWVFGVSASGGGDHGQSDISHG